MAQCTDLTLPNTDCTCTVCRWHFEHARSERKTQSGAIISNASMDTKTTSTPATPIPIGQRAEMITCLCFVNTLSMPGGTIAQQRCTRFLMAVWWHYADLPHALLSPPSIILGLIQVVTSHTQICIRVKQYHWWRQSFGQFNFLSSVYLIFYLLILYKLSFWCLYYI